MFLFGKRRIDEVFQDPIILERFSRYYNIIQGNSSARYLIAKKVSISIPKDSTIDQFWQAHHSGRKEFQSLLQSIDSNEIDLNDLKSPKFSFLDLKKKLADSIVQSCHFCERRCGVNRLEDELGVCRVGKDSVVSSVFLHMGEEPPLVPSGTIFFCGCVLKCVFCQNWSISQEWKSKNGLNEGRIVTPKELTSMQASLKKEGAININWVGGDPVPNIHNIIESLQYLDLNVVQLWNSSMYLTPEAMDLLIDIMDFWLPDLKYFDDNFAFRISKVKNYTSIVTRNITNAYHLGSGEMIIRHLCMPGRIDLDTVPILKWSSKNVPNALINIMKQYRPEYLVQRGNYPEINSRVSNDEISKARRIADELNVQWRQVS